MNVGYVSFINNGVNENKNFDYSATTNEFASVTFPFGYNVLFFDVWIDETSFDKLEDIYVYSYY